MKSKVLSFSKWSTLLLVAVFCVFCAKKDPDPTTSSTSNVGVVIKTGAKTLDLGQSIKLEANIVDAQGNAVPASSITWTSSDPNIATINGNVLTSVASGQVVVTASYTSNGATTTSKMIFGVAKPTSLFTVAPEAIIWTTGAGTIDLTPVYFGTGTPSFTYTSSDASIVTVNAAGQVSFVAAGSATITVKATGLSGTPEILVPVLVVGTPTAPLPVTRVTITPNNSQLFKGQTLQLAAKAYNSSNAEVTGETAVWSVENDTNNLRKNAVSISQTGLLSATYEGNATIYATIKGITAQASVQVLPDSVIIVTPYYVSKNAGTTQQFTAKLYKVSHTTKQIDTTNTLTLPSNLTWSIPSFAQYSSALSIFDIATINSSGLATIKSDATAGFSTAVQAYIPGTGVGGAALIMINVPGVNTSTTGGINTSSIPGI